jgi:hypothetical protein
VRANTRSQAASQPERQTRLQQSLEAEFFTTVFHLLGRTHLGPRRLFARRPSSGTDVAGPGAGHSDQRRRPACRIPHTPGLLLHLHARHLARPRALPAGQLVDPAGSAKPVPPGATRRGERIGRGSSRSPIAGLGARRRAVRPRAGPNRSERICTRVTPSSWRARPRWSQGDREGDPRLTPPPSCALVLLAPRPPPTRSSLTPPRTPRGARRAVGGCRVSPFPSGGARALCLSPPAADVLEFPLDPLARDAQLRARGSERDLRLQLYASVL